MNEEELADDRSGGGVGLCGLQVSGALVSFLGACSGLEACEHRPGGELLWTRVENVPDQGHPCAENHLSEAQRYI